MNSIKSLLLVVLGVVGISISALAKPVTYAAASSGGKELGLNLGFGASALNLGVNFDSSHQTGAAGGYFFLQTEKKDAGINQIMSFGGHIAVNLVDTNGWVASIHPGLGVSMIKGLGSASDKTVVGPSLRYGVEYKLANGAIGLDRLEVWNWFDDKTTVNATFTALSYKINL